MKKGVLSGLFFVITGCSQQAQLDSGPCVSDQSSCETYLGQQCSLYTYTLDSFNPNAPNCPTLNITCESGLLGKNSVLCSSQQLDNFSGCPCQPKN